MHLKMELTLLEQFKLKRFLPQCHSVVISWKFISLKYFIALNGVFFVGDEQKERNP